MLTVKVTNPAVFRDDTFVSVNDGGGWRLPVHAYAICNPCRRRPGQPCCYAGNFGTYQGKWFLQPMVYSGLTDSLNGSSSPFRVPAQGQCLSVAHLLPIPQQQAVDGYPATDRPASDNPCLPVSVSGGISRPIPADDCTGPLPLRAHSERNPPAVWAQLDIIIREFIIAASATVKSFELTSSGKCITLEV